MAADLQIAFLMYFVEWKCFNHDYRQVSNISRTLVGYKIVDHSDVVRASPVGAAGFNILRIDNCKPRREIYKFRDLVCLILEILR